MTNTVTTSGLPRKLVGMEMRPLGGSNTIQSADEEPMDPGFTAGRDALPNAGPSPRVNSEFHLPLTTDNPVGASAAANTDEIADTRGLEGPSRAAFKELARHIDEIHNMCVLDPHSYKNPSLQVYFANLVSAVSNNLMSWMPASVLSGLLAGQRREVAQGQLAECVVSQLSDPKYATVLKELMADFVSKMPAGTERMFHGPTGQFAAYSLSFGLAATLSLVSEPVSQSIRQRMGGANYEFGLPGGQGSPVSFVRSQVGNAVAHNFVYLNCYIFFKTFIEAEFLKRVSDPSTAMRMAAGGGTSVLAALVSHMVLQAVLVVAAKMTLGRAGVDNAGELGTLTHRRQGVPLGVFLREPALPAQTTLRQEGPRANRDFLMQFAWGLVGTFLAAGTAAALSNFGIGGGRDFQLSAANATSGPNSTNGTSNPAALTASDTALQSTVPLLLAFTVYWLVTNVARMVYAHRTQHPDKNPLRQEIGTSRILVKRLQECTFEGYDAVVRMMLSQCAHGVQQMGLTRVLTKSPLAVEDTQQALSEIAHAKSLVERVRPSSDNPEDNAAAARVQKRIVARLEVIEQEITRLEKAVKDDAPMNELAPTQNRLAKALRQLPHMALQAALSDERYGSRFELEDLARQLSTDLLPLSLCAHWKIHIKNLAPIYSAIGLHTMEPADSAVEQLVKHKPPNEVIDSFDIYAVNQPELRAKFEHWLGNRPAVKNRDDFSACFMLQALQPEPGMQPSQEVADRIVADMQSTRVGKRDASALMAALRSGEVDVTTLDQAVQRLVPADHRPPQLLFELREALKEWTANAMPDGAGSMLLESYRADVDTWPSQMSRMLAVSSSMPNIDHDTDMWVQLMQDNKIMKNDAHFHHTNYSMTNTSLPAHLRLMDANGVLRTNAAGLPNGQTKCCGAAKYYSLNRYPLEYIDPDSNTYHQLMAMPPEQRARIEAAIVNINMGDPWFAERQIADAQRKYGEAFSVAGENTKQKEIVADKNAAALDILKNYPPIVRALAGAGIPEIFHNDAQGLRGKRGESVDAMVEVIAKQYYDQARGHVTQRDLDMRAFLGEEAKDLPAARFRVSWAHFGIGKFNYPPPGHSMLIASVLSGDAFKRHVDDCLDRDGVHDPMQRAQVHSKVQQTVKKDFKADISWDYVAFWMLGDTADMFEREARNSTDPQCAQNLRDLSQAFRAYVNQYKMFMLVGGTADKAEDIGKDEQTAAYMAAAQPQFERTQAIMAAAISRMASMCRHEPTREVFARCMREQGPAQQNNWLHVLAKHSKQVMFGTDALTPEAKAHGRDLFALNVQACDLFFRLFNGMETGDPLVDGDISMSIARTNFDDFHGDEEIARRRKLSVKYEQNRPYVQSAESPHEGHHDNHSDSDDNDSDVEVTYF